MNYNADFFAVGLLWYVAFLFSTTCHEAAHALVAKWGGDSTAAMGGQVSLNPLPHIRRAVVGMVVFPILSYVANGWMMGWASAPYDPHWSRMYPRRAAKMALAGPAANFILAILAGSAIVIGLHTHYFAVPDSYEFDSIVDATTAGAAEGLARFLSLMFSLNILLGTFNLIPVPPLDGFSAIPIFLSEEQGQRYLDMAESIGSYSLVGMFLAWKIFGHLFEPIFVFAVQTLYR